MALKKIEKVLTNHLDELKSKGTLKGKETVITGIKSAQGDSGPRYYIQGFGDKEFLRMNANNYLGMSLKKEIIEAEEKAARMFGTGPGAVRFISGTYSPHVELEKRLAEFHDKEAAMIFSSAYATVMGILPPLISRDTIVISDELNHNCIINAVRLSRPKDKKIYKHKNMKELEDSIHSSIGNSNRLLTVTDGIFSMRGDYAPLSEIADLAEKYDSEFEEGIITIVDDSHGVGAIGERGRGTTEYTHEDRIDILVSTLGKAIGVNGGYLVSSAIVVEYLRETAPFYIYSNNITVSEASAALRGLELLDSEVGRKMLNHLHEMTAFFERGLIDLGYEVIRGEHPVVPLMIRDTRKTIELVRYLEENGVLVTGLNYPVVPKGDEEIRFQICADHTKSDINYVLNVLKSYKETHQK
jgi:glycine C-acetyltransferase